MASLMLFHAGKDGRDGRDGPPGPPGIQRNAIKKLYILLLGLMGVRRINHMVFNLCKCSLRGK